MGIIKLANVLKIGFRKALENFSGVDRRLQELGTRNGITVIDDYANLPTAFRANIKALKEKYSESRIWAVIEPHTFSRPKVTLSDYPSAFNQAHQVIISKIFASRETDPGNFSGADVAAAAPHSLYIPEFSDIAAHLKQHAQPGDVILVMGSGDSSKLAHLILDTL